MRVKKPEIMEHIISFVNEFRREYGRSPSTSEIGAEVGVAKGTAYTYLTRMNELGMIRYDGKDIITNLSERINKEVNRLKNTLTFLQAFSDLVSCLSLRRMAIQWTVLELMREIMLLYANKTLQTQVISSLRSPMVRTT